MTEKNDDVEPDDSTSYLITGKALERYFKLNDAVREFAQLFQEEKNERAAAIVGGAFLDTLLEHILFNFLAEDGKEVQRLLDPEQPLGTYGARVRVVYCLGLIGKIVRDDLRLVGKIRNRFAHDLRASFEEEPIRSWCLSLKWHEYSMFKKAPKGVTAGDIFQVGVNQLASHLNGIVSIARREKRKIRREV
jgi:hypothetical protein